MVNEKKELPVGTVTDEPRFAYRGMMLDVSRHFFDVNFVKKQIDAFAYYKLNRLHLHLTDAAGWRIEIDKYPRLTEFAAWREFPPGKSGGTMVANTVKKVVRMLMEVITPKRISVNW